jgi:tetratricopeptide (TPR) repeat protein
MRRSAVAIAVALTASRVAIAQPAPAPSDAEDVARAKADSAKAAFDRGEYKIAVENYREAYRLMPRSGLLYNLGQAYRLSGMCAEAADAYREYLRLEPETPYRTTVEQNLAAADVCARDAEAAKQREAARVAAGMEVDPAVAARANRRAHAMRRTGMGLAALGGGLLVAGGYFAYDAKRASDEVSDFYVRGGAWDEIEDSDARGRRSQLISRVTVATGVAALAGGITLYVLGQRATVTPGREGAKVVVSWRF